MRRGLGPFAFLSSKETNPQQGENNSIGTSWLTRHNLLVHGTYLDGLTSEVKD